MERIFNFSAGPSMLPQSVLEKAQKDIFSYADSGMGVMELSHRSEIYKAVITQAEEKLRTLMGISKDYAVLFVHGGATLQFSSIPMNLAHPTDKADYVITDEFSIKAFSEASLWVQAKETASSKDENFTYIPSISQNMLSPNSQYLHITVNNTVYGTMYNKPPQIGKTPLIGDMTSIILGKKYKVEDFSLIYAGTQKNMGIAGLAVIIIRRSLYKESASLVPSPLNFKKLDENKSMVNTPPAFPIYMAGLMFDWTLSMGGVEVLQKINEEKASLLYDFIDNSKLFKAPALAADRSIMNIRFVLPDEDTTASFLTMCENKGLLNLKGHRSAGGCRASIYNAMPIEGVKALVQCMKAFEHSRLL